jgi:hypothetical protein
MNAADVPLCEGLRQEFIRAQARVDSVAKLFGDFAPPWFAGERLSQYRARLLRPYLPHSKSWKDVDLTSFADKALDVVESQVYSDAKREAAAPTNVPTGTLVERVSTDATGRRITKFHGDPEVCWAPFKVPSRAVVGWAK